MIFLNVAPLISLNATSLFMECKITAHWDRNISFTGQQQS